MTAAALTTAVLHIKHNGTPLVHFSGSDPVVLGKTLLFTIVVTSVVWLVATFVTSPEPESKLLEFYRRVRPSVTGWKHVAELAPEVRAVHDGWYNVMDWLLGCLMVYMVLFGTGKILLGSATKGIAMFGVAAVCGYLIYWDLDRRGWETLSGRDRS